MGLLAVKAHQCSNRGQSPCKVNFVENLFSHSLWFSHCDKRRCLCTLTPTLWLVFQRRSGPFPVPVSKLQFYSWQDGDTENILTIDTEGAPHVTCNLCQLINTHVKSFFFLLLFLSVAFREALEAMAFKNEMQELEKNKDKNTCAICPMQVQFLEWVWGEQIAASIKWGKSVCVKEIRCNYY